MKKIVAFNGSPKMEKGNTTLILEPFLEGMREEGGEVEIYYTMRLKINPCLGEFDCWLKNPGRCFQDDDMNTILPKIAEADILVFATPLYVDGMSGPMKNLFDRIIPLVQPFFVLREDHCRHMLKEDHKENTKVILVSNSGFWERDNFDPLIVQMKAICKNISKEYAGALLRPHGPSLAAAKQKGSPESADILAACKNAGRELLRNGKISDETFSSISRHLVPREIYIKQVNAYFRRIMEQGVNSDGR